MTVAYVNDNNKPIGEPIVVELPEAYVDFDSPVYVAEDLFIPVNDALDLFSPVNVLIVIYSFVFRTAK